jgi:hypothetical protein
VPFCGYNMTTEDGDYALRNRNDWGGRPAVDAPELAALDVDDPPATDGCEGEPVQEEGD